MRPFARFHHPPVRFRAAPFELEMNFGLDPARKEQLRPELTELLHAAFIRHPDYDREHLPDFLDADLYLRVLREGELAGLFVSELLMVDTTPALHLLLGLSPPGRRSGGIMQPLALSVALDLAAQAFGSEDFLVGLRTANPQVVAVLWKCPWVRFYPRRDWQSSDPRVDRARGRFCGQVFGADHCSLDGKTFHDIYPAHPWHGQVPWHHDPLVNAFCREHINDHGSEAILFLGPTLPAAAGLPRRALWPGPSIKPVS